MLGNTHIVGGITASLAFAQISTENPLILVGAGMIGALLPDICHSGSKIGRMFPISSKTVNKIFGHRSFTHSFLFLVCVAVLLNAFVPYKAVILGLLIGMASHLLLDMGTRQGIKLFFPFQIKVRFPLTIKTGGKGEKFIFYVLSLVAFYFAFKLIVNEMLMMM